MNWRSAAALIVATLALAHPALAHGDAPASSFDPLALSFHGYLTADGKLSDAAPAPGSVPFGVAVAPAPALHFALAAPVRFVPGGGFDVAITLRADRPVVTGDGIEIGFTDADPMRVALDPVLAPGTVATARATLQAPGALYDEGAPLELTVRPLMPALAEGSLAIVIGGDAPSTFDMIDMRVPTPTDLRLQDVAHTEFLLDGESFAPPPTHSVNTILVHHDSIERGAFPGYSANGTYVVLRGEEEAAAQAHATTDRDKRVEAAHEFRVNGVVARVHPGLGVVVRVMTPTIVVSCVQNCPAAGFTYTLAPEPLLITDPPSALVPPPRDTNGIPVSADEPEPKETPIGGILLVALVAAAIVLRRRP